MKKLDARHVHGRYGSEDEFDSCSEWDDDEAVDRAWDGVARSTARQTGTVTRSRDQLSATAADQTSAVRAPATLACPNTNAEFRRILTDTRTEANRCSDPATGMI